MVERFREKAFVGASVWAGNPVRKISGCMRIGGDKIVGVFEHGSSAIGSAELIDLEGMHIVPGFIDAHQHFFQTAFLSLYGNAASWASKDDALDAVREACARAGSEDEWICFSRMDYSKWKKPSPPTIREIDAVSGGRPVFVPDITLHRALVSSRTIEKAGLDRQYSRFLEDVDTTFLGNPKGLVWEEALGKVLFAMYRDVMGRYSDEQKLKVILAEADRCLKMGITHVHDPGVPHDAQVLLSKAQNRTKLKISWSVTSHEGLYTPPDAGDEYLALHSCHASKSVKFFLDGAHRTAASIPISAGLKAFLKSGVESMSERSMRPLQLLFEQKLTLQKGRLAMPYSRFPDTADLVRKASGYADKGYRLVLHALGNIASLQAAEILNILKPIGGASVEHMIVMSERDLDAFASCGAVSSVQPGFIPVYADTLERQGAVPCLKTFALNSMRKRGIPICISSDGPCGSNDPLFNIRRAVDRRKMDGTMLDPAEAITREQAVAAASIGGSLSLGNGNKGLSEGSPATFSIVSGDPFSESSRVIETWINGERVC